MCDKEDKDMQAAEIARYFSENKIISNRETHLRQSLSEVEAMEKGQIPKESARDFLKEIRSK